TVSPSPVSPTPVAQGNTFSGKVADLLKQGQNLTCTFQRADATGTISGTVYVAGEGQRLKGDFNVQQSGSTGVTGHVMREAQTMYVWSDQLPQGTKFTIVEESPAPVASDTSEQFAEQSFNYTCLPWVVDQSVFTLPTDKQFVDVSAQLQPLQGAATSTPTAQQCASCNQLQEPGKSQCLQALGC
ncbi:MAG: hypothetical protein AAB538_04775, partial [Patescibacteria group bacterium]